MYYPQMTKEGSGGGSAIRADDLQEIVVTANDRLEITHWNRAGADITGLSRESVLGRQVASLFDSESWPGFDGLIGILGRGGTVPGVELRLRTRYDHFVDVEVTGYAEVTQDGVGSMTLVMRDITLRSLLEERRDRLERMFRTLVEHAPSMIYITDAAGRIEFVNSAVERILGYAPRDLRGRDLLEIVHPEDRDRASWPIHERRTGGRATVGYRVRFQRKQGPSLRVGLQTIVCSLNSVGLYFSPPQGDPEPRYSGTEGIAQDITEYERLKQFSSDVGALLPICSSCRRIKEAGPKGESWTSLERYLKEHTRASLSHTYCPECLSKIRENQEIP
jgi:PAS domain S-box-containing protein